MKKWFKDTNTREAQLLPIELRGHSDGRRGVDVTDKESYYIIMWYGKNDDNWSYQVRFNCCQNYKNNMWQIFLFDDKDELVTAFALPSKTLLPPVWNRELGGIDYHDYIFVMKRINARQKHYNVQEFPIDYSRKGKFIHLVKFPDGVTYEDVIQRGVVYNILAIKAENDEGLLSVNEHTDFKRLIFF